jgi:hypothetical protein
MVSHMSAMIQIRNVPEATHRALKSRAALAGMSLSDYLLKEVERIVEQPTMEEMMARLREDGSVSSLTDPVDILREERDRH